MTEVRGTWRPAWVAAARVLRAQLTARGSDPAFTDADGTLTRNELVRLVRTTAERRRRGAGPHVVSSDDPRTVVVEALGGLLARRSVIVVAPNAGRVALQAALATSPGRPGIFLTTSGTTGTARVVRSRPGLGAAAQLGGLLGRLPGLRRPVVACLAPLSHGHGFSTLLGTLALGGHFVALGPDAVAQLAALPHVNVLTGVPLQLRELADNLDAPVVRIDIILSGSDRLTDGDRIGALLKAEVADAYGSTETGTVTLATPSDRRRSPGTVGHPLPGVRIREQHGRLVISSPMLGRGTFAADAGFIRDGLVHVTGRADGARVTGGVTTDPAMLRTWLLAREDVSGADVASVPDERFGSRLAVVVDATGPLDPESLRRQIRSELGAAAVPVRIDVR